MDLTIARTWALPLEKTGHRCLMVCLAKYSISTGYAWCSVATLARECCTTPRTIHNWLNELIELGYVVRKARRRKDGGKTSSRYFLQLPAFAADPMVPPDRADRDGVIREVEAMHDDGMEHGDGDTCPADPVADGGEPKGGRASDPVSDEGKESLESESEKDSSDRGSDTPPELELGESTDSPDPVDEALEQIWDHVKGKPAAKRSSKAEVRAALARIHKAGKIRLESVVWAWNQYMATQDARKDDGMFVPGPHRWLGKERYYGFLEDQEDEGAKAARSGSRDMGTLEAPSPLAQEIWMMGYARDRSWKEAYGPVPGLQGCRVAPEIQRKHGVEPYGGEA